MPAVSPSTDEFYESLQTVLDGLGGSESGPLSDLIQCENVLTLHKLVSTRAFEQHKPVVAQASHLTQQIIHMLQQLKAEGKCSSMMKELVCILSNVYIGELMSCHDCIADRDYEPVLPDIPFQVDEDDDIAVKIVRLVKQNEPLGATIKCEDDGSVIIARVLKGGVAHRSGCIMVGDRVLEINDISVQKKQPAEILKLLTGVNGTVTFKLVPAPDSVFNADVDQSGESLVRVRALFTYLPQEDNMHPCPEAGLSFRKGDILCVVDSSDSSWWQAKIQTPSTPVSPAAGIIPSRSLLERKALMRSRASNASQSTRRSTATNRSKKTMYETNASHIYDSDEVKSYEEVSLLYPRPDLDRPVVLIGPPGVGRNELKKRLLMLNADRYGTTVPHTSRHKRPGETDAVDYNFVDSDHMLEWARLGRFIEYGEYRGNMYGTLAQSVSNVLKQGRVPILNPHPQALRLLRTSELKPFIVMVCPPPFDALKESRQATKALSTLDSNSYSRQFSDRELQQMIEVAEELDTTYGHLVDYTLVNANLEFAFRELCDVLRKLETQPSWVPTKWIK